MRVVHTDDVVPAEARGAVVAIGNFDGVHLGHQALIATAARMARASNSPVAVLTFEPHPSRLLNPAFAPPLINSKDDKLRALDSYGVDVCAQVRFDASTASLSPAQFVDDVIVGWLHARAVVVGEGFHFGHKAAGSVVDLTRALPVEVVAAVRAQGIVVSSTKIRELVREGRVDTAALLIGRPYTMGGEVARGDGRGRTIGVPTANVQVACELMPKLGVYASWLSLPDGRRVASVTNIGIRPTFQGDGVRVETHALDFDEDLYGQHVHVELTKHLRDERRFGGLQELKAQIALDIVDARALLAPH